MEYGVVVTSSDDENDTWIENGEFEGESANYEAVSYAELKDEAGIRDGSNLFIRNYNWEGGITWWCDS